MTKRTNLASALKPEDKTPVLTQKPSQESPAQGQQAGPPSRKGKKAITSYHDPAVSKELKQLALDQNTTVQSLMEEALNDLFSKNGRNPIA